MSEEELININGIREDLYQSMQIGDITLRSRDSQELYDFMNYQDKEIERLNNNKDNAINFIDQVLMYHLRDYKQLDEDINTLIGILRGSDKE